MSVYKLFDNSTTRQYLSKFQHSILAESVNNDIFFVITTKMVRGGVLIQAGKLIVLDDRGNRYSQYQRNKSVKVLLENIWGEVACLPGRKGENIKTRSISLCYGKTFYRKTKEGYKKEYGSYSCNTDLLVGEKWGAGEVVQV